MIRSSFINIKIGRRQQTWQLRTVKLSIVKTINNLYTFLINTNNSWAIEFLALQKFISKRPSWRRRYFLGFPPSMITDRQIRINASYVLLEDRMENISQSAHTLIRMEVKLCPFARRRTAETPREGVPLKKKSVSLIRLLILI